MMERETSLEEEVEDIEEDEDEEEVVVLGDVGCAAMRAGAALRAAAASVAASARRMGGISSGCVSGRVDGGVRPRPCGPVGRSGWQRWAGEARGCGLRFPGLVGLGSCNV